MKTIVDHVVSSQLAHMSNKAMQNKLMKDKAIDVRMAGTEVEKGVFELREFVDDVDYCDAQTESWIWSIGRRLSDRKIFASTDTRFYQNSDYHCLWLR